MKLKTLLLIITPIIFLLTGCNNAPSAVHSEETVPITTETPEEVVEAVEPSPSPVKEPTASGEVEGEIVKSESVENEQVNPYDYIDGAKHITDNLDGTYAITEEYAGTLSMFDYFDGMTKSEIEAELGDWLGGTLKYAVKAEEAEEFISSLKRTEATPVPTEYVENDEYSSLDGRIHITQNEDGTLNYSDEYIGALAMYDYFDGMTEAEIKEDLDFLLGYSLIGLDGQKTDLYISGLIRLKDILPQSTPVPNNTGASEEQAKNSPYISERNGVKEGDTWTLDDGVKVTYKGKDEWMGDNSITYKVTEDLGNGSLRFEGQVEQQATVIDSPYASERAGYTVGQKTTALDGATYTYQGEDKWFNEENGQYYIAKERGDGGLEIHPEQTDTSSQDTPAQQTPSNPTHYAEDHGYAVGDTMTGISKGKSLTLTYLGNDKWVDENGRTWTSYEDESGDLKWFYFG